MKKLVCLMLSAVLMLTSVAALADTTKINPQENRGIKLQDVGLNEVEEGISPTTGLTLSTLTVPEGFSGMADTGRYMPMMVQIDNSNGGINAPGAVRCAPWGATYADIVYETMLHRDGQTRLSFIFNDLLPDRVGPIRSARVGHVWIREEWGAAYLYHGRQEFEGTNVIEELNKLGHPWIDTKNQKKDPLIFDNNSGSKVWNDYFNRRSDRTSPHNVTVSVSGIYNDLVPADYVAPNHTFKFTDETPEGDTAMNILISWRSDKKVNECDSNLIYDIDSNTYLRYMRHNSKNLYPWVDEDGTQIGFANVIVQFTETIYHDERAPIQRVTAADYGPVEGNADFFMAGKHIAGYWKRDSVTDRTVYYGPDGEEISLQRGKTLIIIFPDDIIRNTKKQEFPNSITYSDKLSGE